MTSPSVRLLPVILAVAALFPAPWLSAPAAAEDAVKQEAVTADDCAPFGPQFREETFASNIEALCRMVLEAATTGAAPSDAIVAADAALSHYLDIIDALSVRVVPNDVSGVRVEAWRDVPPMSKYLIARRLGLLDLAAAMLPPDLSR